MQSNSAKRARLLRGYLIFMVALLGSTWDVTAELHTKFLRFGSAGDLDDGTAGGDATLAAALDAHGDPTGSATSSSSSSILKLLQAAKQYRARNGGRQMLRHRDVSRALYMGDLERIRSFVGRMAEGQKLTIALVGGSVSKGMGAVAGEPSFELWLNMWLRAVLPENWNGTTEPSGAGDGVAASANTTAATISRSRGLLEDIDGDGSDGSSNGNSSGSGHDSQEGAAGVVDAARSTVRVVNAACPATSSDYMNLCLREYLRDADVDLVLLEYAINDPPFPIPQMLNERRKSFEQLVRKLLRLPKRPAVVLLNMYRWFSQSVVDEDGRPSDTYCFTNAEAQFFEFATYYGLQVISLKAAVYHHMRAATRGFQVHTMRYLTRRNSSADPEALFYEDPMHPSGLTGHRVVSELVVGLLLSVARGMVARPWRPSEEEQISAPLPAHMLPDNYDTDLDICLMGESFMAAATDVQGFQWLNEGKNPLAPKWGYTATTPNASIAFTISHNGTTGAEAEAEPSAEGAAAAPPPGGKKSPVLLLVILAFLRSYENMGVAAVSCEGGCVCGEEATVAVTEAQGAAVAAAAVVEENQGKVIARLDGLSQEHHSQLQLGCFRALLLEPTCRVRVRVEDVGRGGINKVKLGGLIVSHTAPNSAQAMCNENLEAAERAAGFRE